MSAPYNPRVAFGLQCAAAALRAKMGLAMREIGPELRNGLALVPEDDDAAAAVEAFLDRLDTDPVAAGDGMLEFLTSREDSVEIARDVRRAETMLREAKARTGGSDSEPPRYDWQDRKDIGG